MLLKRVVETGRSAQKSRVTVDVPGEGRQLITLSIDPVTEQGSDSHYLIVFVEDGAQITARIAAAPDEPSRETVLESHLESDLRDTREQLQALTEEHETSLEELRSANEELHSVNEELQSANEELETSKEEIQSVNEELQTVNAELAIKVDELNNRNSDLQNFFAGTEVATIFLDQHLVIRGFTPAVAGLYNLIPSDVGRPITDIASHLQSVDLRTDILGVLNTLEVFERQVVLNDGAKYYLMRVLPYRAPNSKVDGVVVTFVEVTSIVQAEEHQRLLVNELNHRVKNMLTVVISLATQTLRGATTLAEFSETFVGRVHALTAAYSLLSSEAWQSVSLREVINEELKPFMAGEKNANIVLDGPAIKLQPRAALALGMAIHELTTNAVKYGALSVAEGSVSVTWRVEQQADDKELTLEWVESGGPVVAPPTHRGFGTKLIERGLRQDMSAVVTVEFAPAGLRARLRAPLRMGQTAD